MFKKGIAIIADRAVENAEIWPKNAKLHHRGPVIFAV